MIAAPMLDSQWSAGVPARRSIYLSRMISVMIDDRSSLRQLFADSVCRYCRSFYF
jgi:hypothetical protein